MAKSQKNQTNVPSFVAKPITLNDVLGHTLILDWNDIKEVFNPIVNPDRANAQGIEKYLFAGLDVDDLQEGTYWEYSSMSIDGVAKGFLYSSDGQIDGPCLLTENYLDDNIFEGMRVVFRLDEID